MLVSIKTDASDGCRTTHLSPGENTHRSPGENTHRSPGENTHRSPDEKRIIGKTTFLHNHISNRRDGRHHNTPHEHVQRMNGTTLHCPKQWTRLQTRDSRDTGGRLFHILINVATPIQPNDMGQVQSATQLQNVLCAHLIFTFPTMSHIYLASRERYPQVSDVIRVAFRMPGRRGLQWWPCTVDSIEEDHSETPVYATGAISPVA